MVGWTMFRADSLTRGLMLLRQMFLLRPGIYDTAMYMSHKTIVYMVIGIVLCGPFQALVPCFKKHMQMCIRDRNQVVLKVEKLRYKEFLKDISFELHKGEILGFAGLVGAGRTEVAKCMIGAYRKDGGTVTYKGEKMCIRDSTQGGYGEMGQEKQEHG